MAASLSSEDRRADADDCIVCNVTSRSFSSWNYEEKVKIVQEGRPMPDLNITTAMKSCVRKFNSQLYMTSKSTTGFQIL